MAEARRHDLGRGAFRLLQIAFIVAPIVAGLDKFFHYLVDWNMYLSPYVANYLRGYGNVFMMIVGVVEIIVGIGNIIIPKVFAYITCAWLIFIILNLLSTGHFFDIALRDLGLALAAFSLGLLAQKYT